MDVIPQALLFLFLFINVIVIIMLAFLILTLYRNSMTTKKLHEMLAAIHFPNQPETFSGDKADRMLEKGDMDELKQYCDRYFEDAPNSVHINWYYALANYNQGNYQEAQKYFKKVIRINPLWRDGAIVYLQEIAEHVEEETTARRH